MPTSKVCQHAIKHHDVTPSLARGRGNSQRLQGLWAGEWVICHMQETENMTESCLRIYREMMIPSCIIIIEISEIPMAAALSLC